MDRHRVTIKAPHATRGKLWGIIKESAVAMLMDRAVLGSGGFREWLYSEPYRISNRALADIDYLIGRGNSATQVVEVLCTRYNRAGRRTGDE